MGKNKPPKKKPKKKKRSGTNRPYSGQGELNNLAKLFIPPFSPVHPLERCIINQNWQEIGSATVFVVRKGAAGLNVAGFLVDLSGAGLKKSFSFIGITPEALSRILATAPSEFTWADCSLELAQEMVYGGLAWARKHGFNTPPEAMAYLETLPPPQNEPDTSLFGGQDDGSGG